MYLPAIISSLRDKGVEMLAAGCYHSIAVTSNGMLYVFGRNNHGQLATGDLEERHIPHPIDDFIGQKIVSVSAGFYHTLVLTADNINAHNNLTLESLQNRNAPSCIRQELLNDGSTLKESCLKQLALNLQKDLELVTGIDSVEGPQLPKAAFISSVTCRDLLIILIKNIGCFMPTELILEREFKSRLDLILHAISSLLKLSWRIIKGNNSHCSLPLSSPDATILIKRLLPIANRLLASNRQYILNSLQSTMIPDDYLDINLNICSDNSLSSVTPTEHIQRTMYYFRCTILQIYFEYSDVEMVNNDGESLVNMLCDTIVHCFDVLFYHPRILNNMLLCLKQSLTSDNTISVKISLDPSRALKLLAVIGKVYFVMDECLKLCKCSMELSASIFRIFLHFFNHYSKLTSMDKAFCSIKSVEVRKVVTVLEQTLSNLVKCILPSVYESIVNNKDTDFCSQLATNIITDMLLNSIALLDSVLHQTITDDLLGSLRYGTILPSLLPTALLYIIAFTKKGFYLSDIFNLLQVISSKLQSLCKHEISIFLSKNNKSLSGIDFSTDFDKDGLDQQRPDCIAIELVVEESLYWKKDCGQISWWYRLLKLSTYLMSAMNFGKSCKDVNQFLQRYLISHTPIWTSKRGYFDTLFRHSLWSDVNILLSELTERCSCERFPESDFNAMKFASAKNNNLLEIYRKNAKDEDLMYRVLSQSSANGRSWSYFEELENILFTTAISFTSMMFPMLSFKFDLVFKEIVKVIKYLYSKRTVIISGNPLESWHDSLKLLVSFYHELCLFISKCCAMNNNFQCVPIAIPFRRQSQQSASKRRWRRSIMTVVYMNRWRKYSRSHNCMIQLPLKIVDFIHNLAVIITEEFTKFNSEKELLKLLRMELLLPILGFNKELVIVGEEINNIYNTLTSATPSILRNDILLECIAALSGDVQINLDDPITSVDMDNEGKVGLQMLNASCFDKGHYEILVVSLQCFHNELLKIVENISQRILQSDTNHGKYYFSLVELQYLLYCFKLLESMHYSTKLKNFRQLLEFLDPEATVKFTLLLFEKYTCWTISGDEKPQQSSNLGSTNFSAGRKQPTFSRERILAIKKLILGIISYLRTLVFSTVNCEGSINCHVRNKLLMLGSAYNVLLFRFQQHRNKEHTFNQKVGSLYNPTHSSENNSNFENLNNNVKQNNREAMNNKKRCQDIIVKPYEFSRNSEGIMIPGEKLLNNCKGVDYSVATWVYLLNRPQNAASAFLFGKINSSEGWPLIILKSDGKLEILYGNHNECEKAISEAVLPMYCWIHITVVIEQKKIKLFINSQLDTTITTNKGNSKSILFPLLISTCPISFKTKLSLAKAGFDGMLAHCKYYSRALSPIHIKVIFDHGPPETIDLSAKVMFSAMCSLKVLYNYLSVDIHEKQKISFCVSETVKICFNIYSLELNRRNRAAAIELIKLILLKFHNLLNDLTVTQIHYLHDGSKSIIDGSSLVSLLECPWIPHNCQSFYKAFAYYILRIVGTNILQHILPMSLLFTSEQSFQDTIRILLSYTPKFAINKDLLDQLHSLINASSSNADDFNNNISPNSSSCNGYTEKLSNIQDESVGEVSCQLISTLHYLIGNDRFWMEIFVEVINEILHNYSNRIKLSDMVLESSTSWIYLDLIAVSVLLGGISSGLFLGCRVLNYYDSNAATIIHVNHSLTNVVLLSDSSPSRKGFNEVKLLKVKSNDLIFTDYYYDTEIHNILPFVFAEILDALNSLSPFIQLLSRDYLSIEFTESLFQNKSLCPLLSTLEIFVFEKLFYSISNYVRQTGENKLVLEMKNDFLVGRWAYLSRLMENFQLSLRNNDNASKVISQCDDSGYSHSYFLSSCSGNNMNSSLSKKWFRNLKTFAIETIATMQQMRETSNYKHFSVELNFPLENDEVNFFDFMHKSIGLQYDKHIRQSFYQYGLIFRALVCQKVDLDLQKVSGVFCKVRTLGWDDKQASMLIHYKNLVLENTTSNPESRNNFLSFFSYVREHLQKIIFNVILSGVSEQQHFDNLTDHTEMVLKWVSFCPSISVNSDINSYVHINFNIEDISCFDSSTGQSWCNWTHCVKLLGCSFQRSIETTDILLQSIKKIMENLLHEKYYFQSDVASPNSHPNILISTNLADSLFVNTYYWFAYCYEVFDVNLYYELSDRSMSTLLQIIFSDKEKSTFRDVTAFSSLQLKLLQLCCFIVRSLVGKLCNCANSTSWNGKVLSLLKADYFKNMRDTAQVALHQYEQPNNLHCPSRFSNYVTNFVSNIELLERYRHSYIFKYSESNTYNFEMIVTGTPVVIGTQSDSVELNLENCFLIPAKFMRASDTSMNFKVEVALAAGRYNHAFENESFETVYCGGHVLLHQMNLLPNSEYSIKCRCFYQNCPLAWSEITTFKTLPGKLFTFDKIKCGSDIQISDDGLVASYGGDDVWNTVLGTRSFNCGIVSWEIKIIQSSTAYIFLGIATSLVDLHTFLGGCANGWGFIGEQALYHNREKVKVYGEPFATGDIIKAEVDLSIGSLSFYKNGKFLGTAFERIHGNLFPAVAFYNMGQEVQIISSEFRPTKGSMGFMSFLSSPSLSSLYKMNISQEMFNHLYFGKMAVGLSCELANLIATDCNQWCNPELYLVARTISHVDIYMTKKSELLDKAELIVGDKVRTSYGIAEVAGAAFQKIWFRIGDRREVWFFSLQQILEGKQRKQFQRSSYQHNDYPYSSDCFHSWNETSHNLINKNNSVSDNPFGSKYDSSTVIDLMDPRKWSNEMDSVILSFLYRVSETHAVEPNKVTLEMLLNNFRILQSQLTRLVINNSELTYYWGITGPKRKAVIVRICFLKLLNNLVSDFMPFYFSDPWSHPFESNKAVVLEANIPQIESLLVAETFEVPSNKNSLEDSLDHNDRELREFWSPCSYSWDIRTINSRSMQEIWLSSFHSSNVRKCLFPLTKLRYISDLLKKTATPPAKTDDEYDYPENLPHVKINRLKALRIREACDLLNMSSEDIFMHSLFCQLWRELRQFNYERLRISYTHPMDDGQSRTFKVKFDGEGVDDYGGPYREIFQQIFFELQLLNDVDSEFVPLNTTLKRCFLNFLFPTPNWTTECECSERYCYMFDFRKVSHNKKELYHFFGQLLGIVIRSKITIDLSFPSFIWKCIVGEAVSESDLASFDQACFDMVQRLKLICMDFKSGKIQAHDPDVEAAIADLTWSARCSDDSIVDLNPNGRNISVPLEELELYLTKLLNLRLKENRVAIQLLRKGLFTIVPQSLIGILTWEEFRSLVCGSQTIDIARLQDNTEYDDDLSPQDAHIQFFWEVLKEFSEEEKSAFLRFVWARSSLPPKGVEFSQKMRILNMTSDDAEFLSTSLASNKQDGFLPKAHTCFFSINMPKYSSKEVI